MKTIQRLLLSILTISIIMIAAPVAAMADENLGYANQDGNKTIQVKTFVRQVQFETGVFEEIEKSVNTWLKTHGNVLVYSIKFQEIHSSNGWMYIYAVITYRDAPR